ncbi:MAG: SGNH/GDSL hydrolase family protein [Myxococcaceae bacterium]|nr:SGNH/GDSL hydrolase family protein [Myxococcaceae bacterium]MCI0669458.1 SGNH/GDSL hydrolase family protein [Myxococcaceae bacterium]
MSGRRSMRGIPLAAVLVVSVAFGGEALANTINQNSSWTINRAGATSTYRVVAYGDSIFAGYYGGLFAVARRAAPYVEGEYLAKTFNAHIQVVRRTKSGAKANDIYNNKIVAERSYMQASNVRVVMFEMCGNDYLQARSNLSGQSGTCNFGVLDTALANCTNYMGLAMQAINQYATTAQVKVISNIYYPGYDADNVLTNCTDASTGQKANKQAKFLPYLAKSNWRACNLAAQHGFKCADSFAEYMGADYDSNGDGLKDSDGLRYQPGESEADYVNRISVTLRSTVRDANAHFASAGTSFDYIQSDNTHPTYFKGTVGTGSGSSAPDFTDAQVVNGQNPEWNKWGHEKMGWILSTFDPVAP